MQRLRILFTALALMSVAFLAASCGPDSEDLEPVSWPFLESTESLTINGKEFNAYIAKTETHRRRALNGIAIKKDQAIAYLFPAEAEDIELRFNNNPDPAELIFVDAGGKALSVESVPAFSRSTFPAIFAADGTRIVLQVRQGVAKDLGITKGKAVKTDPNLIDKSKEAEDVFARLYFLRNEQPEDKPEESPSVKLKVLKTAEEQAQLLKVGDFKEGEGVLIPLSGQLHEFWLKDIKGKCCAVYLKSAGRFQNNVIQARYEGIEAKGGSDLEEPIYYSPEDASHLALWKGADYFTKNDIEARAPVALSGVDVMSADDMDWNDLTVKFGDAHLDADVALTEDARKAALLKATTLKEGKAIVLVWDDPSFVEIDAPAGANLWYVQAEGGKYSISQKVNTQGGKVGAKASSRYVICVPNGFEASGELDLPYRLRDLKPVHPPVVFYNAKQKEAVEDRWPTKKNNFKALAHVELAITEAEQRRGLMYRTELRPNYGMIFIYKEEQSDMSYWMKNCKMNLSIAFITEKGVITKIHNVMNAPEPGTPDHLLERYESDGPAMFAVEMKENWFKENNISEGDRIFIPPQLTAE